MPAPTIQTLQRLAEETGYQPGTLEKVLRLLDLLQEIASDRILSDRFVLKGGTALNAFYLGLDRLSVDIDLNYVGAIERESMLRDRPIVEAALNRLLDSQGYSVRRQPVEHAGGKWLARYASALGGNATLELDVNYMARQPLFGAARMDSISLGGIQAAEIPILSLEEIIAGKFVALLDRDAGRDLFDARRILSINDLDWERIKAAVLAIGASGRRDWRTMSVSEIRGNTNEVRQNLTICLPRDHFADTRDIGNWIEETVALCQERFAFLFELTPSEQKFLDSLLEYGEIDASLLNVTPEVRELIGAMPMLAWKAQNVRNYKDIST